MELKVDRLTKQYGAKIAVDRITVTLTAGVTGLLGANGAGKTTLMRMLCGILKPTSGSAAFDGLDVSTEEYRDILGVSTPGFWVLSQFHRDGFHALYVRAKRAGQDLGKE